MNNRTSFAGVCLALFLLLLSGSPASGQKTWTGTVNSDWHTAGNWMPTGVPNSTHIVQIPNTINSPTISAVAMVRTLVVGPSAVLTIMPAGSLDINDSQLDGILNFGTITNRGIIAISNAEEDGIYTEGIFHNEAGGYITVNFVEGEGIWLAGGSFTNKGVIDIGGLDFSFIGRDGIDVRAPFTNDVGGVIYINRCESDGLDVLSNGVFLNKGAIHIANDGFIDNDALEVEGSFTNQGEIHIGAGAAVGVDGILLRDNTFLNDASGTLVINNVGGDGMEINGGAFTNGGSITIGNTGIIGQDAIENRSNFINDGGQIDIHYAFFSGIANLAGAFTHASGTITIDGVDNDGIRNQGGATFTNHDIIRIGANDGIAGDGIDNRAIFINEASGSIFIDSTVGFGIWNTVGASFANKGDIRIGELAPPELQIVFNEALFHNDGGTMHLHGSNNSSILTNGLNAEFNNDGDIHIIAGTGAFTGLRNMAQMNNNSGAIYIDCEGTMGFENIGVFNNSALLQLQSAVGPWYGIFNERTFNNNLGGELRIDRVTHTAVYNEIGAAGINNDGLMVMGDESDIGNFGIDSRAIFNNNSTGEIIIDRSGSSAIKHLNSTFTNSGLIRMGANSGVTGYGLENLDPFFNEACAIIESFAPLRNSFASQLTNSGYMYFDTDQPHFNDASVVNNGVIVYQQDNPVPNLSNNVIIVSPITGECNIVPDVLQIQDVANFSVAATWYSDEAMSMPAGSYDLLNNTFNASNLPQGVNTLYFSISDDVNSCSQTVYTTLTLEDVTPPEISCPATQILNLDANCSAVLPDYKDMATASDNCGEPTLTQSPAPGTTVSNAGNMTVTLTATDASGNSTQCSFTVNKVDITPPTVQCFDQTLTFNGEESFSLNADDLVDADDNCGLESITLSPAGISCDQLGQTVPVTVTVTDVNDNPATCTSNITVTGLPCGWSQNPNGVNCANGNSIAYNPGTGVWTATSSNCFYGPGFTSDATAFAQRTLCGDGSITAQVTDISGTALGWAGVVMRESNAAGAKKAQLTTNLSNFSRREFRTTTNGAANPQQFPSQNRYWLRLVRAGDQFSMSVSANGLAWYFVGAQNVPMNSCIQVGLVATNYQQTSTVTATFANVSFSGSNVAPMAGIEQRAESREQRHRTLEPITINDPAFTSFGGRSTEQRTSDFQVYPNPTSGELNVDLTQYMGRAVRLEVYSIEGQLLQFTEIDEVQTTIELLSLAKYEAGMYLVKVRCIGFTQDGIPDAMRRIVVTR
jgi:regulation of enolase protein 1 (concanavalin A-like superfamily)